MTNELTNHEIARSLGWKIEKSNENDGNCWHLNGIQSDVAPPDYCLDLNAMHEAEDYLSPDEYERYAKLLASDLTTDKTEVMDWHLVKIGRATALQRAKAYIIVKGLL